MVAIPTLKSEHITLRPFVADDADAVQALLQAPEIADATLSFVYPPPPGAAATWIALHQQVAESGTMLNWAIETNSASVVVGTINLGMNARHKRGTIGYWIGVPFWNNGYATEATRMVIQYGFANLAMQRIESSCFLRNPASARVLEKAGMTFEGILRQYAWKNDHFEDVAMYAKLRNG